MSVRFRVCANSPSPELPECETRSTSLKPVIQCWYIQAFQRDRALWLARRVVALDLRFCSPFLPWRRRSKLTARTLPPAPLPAVGGRWRSAANTRHPGQSRCLQPRQPSYGFGSRKPCTNRQEALFSSPGVPCNGRCIPVGFSVRRLNLFFSF